MDKFLLGKGVTGLKITKLLDWIEESWSHPADTEGALTLPPLQRNGVWRPKAILDLWRSVLDGLPIGLFYVQEGSSDRKVVAGYEDRGTTKATKPGFDLVDGQQRIRALALGKGLDKDRCLWVTFKDEAYALRLTSRTQPFGYSEDGSKLNTRQRRAARQRIEPIETKLTFVEGTPERKQNDKVYDSDLFRYKVQNGEKMMRHPPLPFECDELTTMPLAELLSNYVSGGKQALAERTGNSVGQASVDALARGFNNLCKEGAAFMLLQKHAFEGHLLSEFFRRVGAGGTPLSEAEQLYSAFKALKPEVRTVVEGVQKQVSTVFTPAQIMMAILRIANTLKGDRSGWHPGYDKALIAIRGQSKNKEFQDELLNLVSVSEPESMISKAFLGAKSLLSEGFGLFCLSDIILAEFRPELWQVLVFWCYRQPDGIAQSREEAIRFAMFWHFGVERKHQEAAVRLCFRRLAQPGLEAKVFPGLDLYRELVENGAAVALIKPAAMEKIIEASGPSSKWINHNERFPQNIEGVQTAIQWWYAVHMLPWLQRAYLKDAFPDYLPLTEHEDDLPYDRDHICAQSRGYA